LECRRCGSQIAEDAAYCSTCGQPASQSAIVEHEADATTASPRAAAKPRVAYAGFWLRAVAYVIDNILLGVAAGIFILGPLMQRAGISTTDPWALYRNTSRQAFAIDLLMVMAQWLYWALLESSVWQATLGKKLLGLYVTDLEGKRITFARASGRFFGKILSTLTIGIGYLMAGFTPKKQALHDMIAECLVLKKTSTQP